MKNKYFKLVLLFSLLLAFTTVSVVQKTKRQRKGKTYKMIISNDFDRPVVTNVRKKQKKAKEWRKRWCRVSYRLYGRIVRVRRCRTVWY